MPMLMVSIRKMTMEMSHWYMLMQVAVLRTRFHRNIMLMLVMFIVGVLMIVFQSLMCMGGLMLLS